MNPHMFQIAERVLGIALVLGSTEKPLAEKFSAAYSDSVAGAAQYKGCKSLISDAPPLADHDVLAVARLQWLLEKVTPTLSGLFKLSELTALLEFFKDEIFSPEKLESLKADIYCRDDVDFKNRADRPTVELIAKILALTPAQVLSLAELLEDVWHLDIQAGMTLVKACQMRGVLLLPEEVPTPAV